ncbi:uncharacterized protein LOC126852930 isoform X1 [Cataglyphis hispanica]|nr:uncharacterized protein LOC126852930 isoform X1 [Cataglyphis hispanica]XP_050454193.1 uncharacterized protein LOC126852930 isoform X1 [Cataglyphis hispanica]
MGKIWLQVQDACKNVAKLATSVSRVVRDASKSEHSQRNLVQVTDASLVKSSSLCADNICKETYDKNLSTRKERELVVRREREIEDSNDAEASMRQNSRLVTTASRHEMREQEHQNAKKEKNEKSCVFYTECDRYPDIVAFLPQTETYDHDKNIHPQSHLSGSFKYLENSVYLEVRNRGGSDDGRDSMKSTEDKQKSARHKESRSIRHHRNCTSKKCTCCSRIRGSRERHVENQNLQHTALCHEFATAHHQTIRADSDVFRNNPPHGEHHSSVAIPKDNEQRKMSEQIRFCKKIEVDESSECTGDAETAEIEHATRVLSTNPTIHSSQNNPHEPIASTSKYETPLVSSGKSQNNHPGSKSAFYKTAMKFSKKRRPITNNKIIALFKRSGRNIRRKEPSNVTNHDNEMKITQVKPSTVQITREGNKKRININVRQQTLDAIVARILSEFLGETKKNVLMSITLDSESDNDVLDRKEMETQTLLNDNTLAGTDEFNYSNRYPQAMIAPMTKKVQCFVCEKQDCYEIIQSNNSITLEDALVAEYPETSEYNDHFAEQKTNVIS